MTLVLFVEEPSMGIVLEQLLPRLGLDRTRFRIITHDGVSDLERKLPIRLKAWRDPSAAFVVLRASFFVTMTTETVSSAGTGFSG